MVIKKIDTMLTTRNTDKLVLKFHNFHIKLKRFDEMCRFWNFCKKKTCIRDAFDFIFGL